MPIYERAPGVWRVVVWARNKQTERIVRGSREEADAVLLEMRTVQRGFYDTLDDRDGLRDWPDAGGIYFIQVGDDGPIKIGITDNIRSRARGIQSNNPFRIHLRVAFTGGTVADERLLHARFARSRMRGEWFRPDPELLAFIEDALANGEVAA